MKKIPDFKMRVDPEQSAQVQKVIFKHGYSWASGSKNVILIESPFLFFGDGGRLTKTEHKSYFISNSRTEISFEEFMYFYNTPTLPEKWFVLYSTEEQFNKINDYYKKDWVYWSGLDKGYHNENGRTNNWIEGPNIISNLEADGFIQISFEDWEKIHFNTEDNIFKERVIEVMSQALQGYIEDSISTDTEEIAQLQKAWNIVLKLLKNE